MEVLLLDNLGAPEDGTEITADGQILRDESREWRG